MLLWQRKNVPKLAFGAQLAFVIVCMHGIALLLLCIHSVAVHDELSVDVSYNYLIGADIIVVPFQKTVKQRPVSAAPSAKPDVQREATILKDVQKPVQKKTVPAAKKVEPVTPVVNNDVKPEPTREPEKLTVKKPAIEKSEKPTVEKPTVEKPTTDKSAVEKLAVQKQQVRSQPQPAQSAQQVAKQSALPTQTTPQYIGTRQLQTMNIQRAIVEQVHMHWHPPEGLEPDLEVVLTVHIGHSGAIIDVDTKQSSGVFVYDVHARSAVYEMQFPKACWGTTITIAFT